MKYTLFLFVMLLSFKAKATEAQDQWLCTSQGISRTANVFQACGVGEATSESRARAKALDSAMAEFTTVCNASADCDIKRVSISPQRMSCYQDKGTGFLSGGWKCTRLIVVIIGGN